VIAGYWRRNTVSGMTTFEYRRAEDSAAIDAVIDEYNARTAAMRAGRPLPRPAPKPPAAPTRSLRFTSYAPARPLSKMTATDRKRLAQYKGTIAEQSEFGHVESVEIVEGKAAAYVLYWWPFTDGVLVDVKSGEAVADLLDGRLSIADPGLRASVEVAYRAARDAKVITLVMAF
jgi:hypothetical protein